MIKTFDEWFEFRNGMTFDQAWQTNGTLYRDSFRALSRSLRDYVSEMAAAPEAAKATGTAGELPPEWISEVCGADVDGLSYGQGYRRGFNDCRKKVSELQAKLITDEEAWEIIKDEARMQVIDEHGSMAIVIKSPSEAWFIARAILAANNRPSMITAEDCPICKGQSSGIGADGVENDCHECFRREVQAARQPAPVVAGCEFCGNAIGHDLDCQNHPVNAKAPFQQDDEHKAFLATYLDAARKASDNTSAEMILWHANRHWNGKAGEMWRARAALAATAAPVLSDEQIDEIWKELPWPDMADQIEFRSLAKAKRIEFARAVIAATRSQP